MDFNPLKQWRYQQHESDLQQQQQEQPSAKFPKLLLFDSQQQQEQDEQHNSATTGGGSPLALPFFVPELTTTTTTTTRLTDLSPFHQPADSTPTSTRLPLNSIEMGSSYFNVRQWQELELQALIFRHMLAGTSVPPELLHLVKKSLLVNNSSPHSSSPSPYFYHHHPLEHYYSHYHPALLQSGYWGRGAMDPEPGRCRRTDGKKWRCSRDVVTGQKYCERHVHRGRNRSRKPVETPTAPTGGGGSGGGGVGSIFKSNTSLPAQPHTTLGSGGNRFNLSGHSPSLDLIHQNKRNLESRDDIKGLFGNQKEATGDGRSGSQVLRCFFDDWPRSLEDGNGENNSSSIASSTDFSLKLSTGNGNVDNNPGNSQGENLERERLQLNWPTGGWGSSQAAPMGGPLAEVLRSSTTNSSPTSVLHRLQRGSASEISYVST